MTHLQSSFCIYGSGLGPFVVVVWIDSVLILKHRIVQNHLSHPEEITLEHIVRKMSYPAECNENHYCCPLTVESISQKAQD